VVTPYYSKPPTEGLVAHFTAVADATDLPVMVYDIPGRTGVRIGTPALLRLASHPRIVAVKEATGDLFAGSEVLAETGLAYYSGDDALNLAWLAHGAAGVVSVVGHVAGREYAEMVRAVDAGDLPTARRLHARLIPAVRGIMTRTQGAITTKAALQLQGVLPHRTMRLPLVSATDAEVEQLRADLSRSGVL
jgi:4-hydroxy-tetrahydrodipicolinate synthase